MSLRDFVFGYWTLLFPMALAVCIGAIIYTNSLKNKVIVAIFQALVLGSMFILMAGTITINSYFIIKDVKMYGDATGLHVVTTTSSGHIIRSDKPMGIVGDTVFIGKRVTK